MEWQVDAKLGYMMIMYSSAVEGLAGQCCTSLCNLVISSLLPPEGTVALTAWRESQTNKQTKKSHCYPTFIIDFAINWGANYEVDSQKGNTIGYFYLRLDEQWMKEDQLSERLIK